MAEINLLEEYPRLDRDVESRFRQTTDEDRRIARQFGWEFFDGPRLRGYGGYVYDGRWVKIVKKFIEHYGLTKDSAVLDVGCGKGFMLYDFMQVLPGVKVAGFDISEYAINNAPPPVRPFVQIANAKQLSYPDKSFDLVVSITTVHNLPLEECRQSLREIERVSRGHSFITVDAWRNPEEERRMKMWNLTAITYMSTDDWKKLFAEVGYSGDYYWFIP